MQRQEGGTWIAVTWRMQVLVHVHTMQEDGRSESHDAAPALQDWPQCGAQQCWAVPLILGFPQPLLENVML